MAPPAPSRLRRCCGSLWRWARVIAWSVLALLALAVTYLHLVGVPSGVKEMLQTELRSRGIDLQLGRVRLRGLRTFLIENVAVGNVASNSPQFRITRAELQADPAALSQLKLQLDALEIHSSEFLVPLADTAADSVSINGLTATIHFPADGQWQIERLAGRIGNAEINITARVAHPLAMRRWFTPEPRAPSKRNWQDELRKIAANLEQVQFSAPSNIQLHIDADGRNRSALKAHLTGSITGATTPWGKCTQLQLDGTLSPSGDTNQFHVTFRLAADAAEGEWGKVRGVQFAARADSSATDWQLITADWDATASEVKTAFAAGTGIKLDGSTRAESVANESKWNSELKLRSSVVSARSVHLRPVDLTAFLVHPATNRLALDGTWHAVGHQFESPWGRSDRVELNGRIAPADRAPELPEPGAGPWELLAPFVIDWTCNLASITSPKLKIDFLHLLGQWRAPRLSIEKLNAALYGGRFISSAELDIVNRELRSQATFDFDAHQIAPLLTTNAQRWLRQFAWETPPEVKAEVRLILPAWNNRHPEWRKEVLPTVQIAGEFSGTNGSFRKVPVSSARSSFTLTNLIWHLPDLTVTRPEGDTTLDYRWHMFAQDYIWKVQAQIDPTVLRPLLDPPQQRVLDDFKFHEPPRFTGEIRGRWHHREEIGVNGRLWATNFVFRDEHCTDVETTLHYTNLFLVLRDTTVRSGSQHATATGLGFDPIANHLYVTNAVGNLDPHRVTKVIGPKTQAAIEPYRFTDPPMIILNGRIPTHPKADADAHFNVRGQTFRYWKFRASDVSGDAYWRGDHLSISNLHANFYNGKLKWEGHFDFSARHGADFNFRGNVLQADLATLAADLTGKSNRLDGILSGQFTITSANSKSPESWTGFARVRLRDGFLWSIPVFGAFSPLLDRIAPGLGGSRINAASATAIIERGRITTSDLELRSPAVRLQYVGWGDLAGRVDARVQADILRDAWAVGPIVSLAFWPLTKIFEYKVTGTINEPKSEPLYVPRFLTWPLQPFRAIRDVFTPPTPDPLPPPMPRDSTEDSTLP